jgi:hypothetical protein
MNDPAAVGLSLQWTALAAFGLLGVLCVYAARRWPRRAGPIGVAVLVVAVNHIAYYVAFLIFPEWLSAQPTLVWSVVTRLHVAFTFAVILVMAARRKV